MSVAGFMRRSFDHYLYFKTNESNSVIVYLLLYVDHMLLIRQNLSDINDIKWSLSAKFEIKDLDHARRILGMDIRRNRSQ